MHSSFPQLFIPFAAWVEHTLWQVQSEDQDAKPESSGDRMPSGWDRKETHG
jgi:hypothetical protein